MKTRWLSLARFWNPARSHRSKPDSRAIQTPHQPPHQPPHQSPHQSPHLPPHQPPHQSQYLHRPLPLHLRRRRGGLSRLERLKQLAEAKQQEVPKTDPVVERNLLVSVALEKIHKYLNELVENLEVIKPTLPGVYALATPGVPPLEGLAWQRGRVDFRSKNIPPHGERYEQVMLYYKLGAQKPMRITREVPAHEKLKQELQENKIEFQAGEERNERGSMVRVTFHFPCEVDAQLIFKADFDAGAINLALQHVGRFGFLDYQLPPDAFTDQALEELAGYILGEAKTLGTLQRRK